MDEGFRSFPITSRTGRLRRGAAFAQDDMASALLSHQVLRLRPGAAFAQDDMLVVTRGYVALNAPTAEGMVEVHRCGY